MEYLSNNIRRIVSFGGIVSAVFLLIVIIIIASNVFSRLFGVAIIGSFELVQFSMALSISFALSYTALHKAHITVNMLTSRFTKRTQLIIEFLDIFVTLIVLGAIIWATTRFVIERWFTEQTEVLRLIISPIRLVWTFGLILFFLMLVVDFYTTIRQVVKK